MKSCQSDRPAAAWRRRHLDAERLRVDLDPDLDDTSEVVRTCLLCGRTAMEYVLCSEPCPHGLAS